MLWTHFRACCIRPREQLKGLDSLDEAAAEGRLTCDHPCAHLRRWRISVRTWMGASSVLTACARQASR